MPAKAKDTETTNIYQALDAFQCSMPEVEKDAINPDYGSRYLTFHGLLRAIRPVLAKHGLILYFTLEPSTHGLKATGHLRLLSTGEEIVSSLESGCGGRDDQKVGTAVTYLCRYIACSMLSITSPEGDDDGQSSAGKKTKFTPIINPPPVTIPHKKGPYVEHVVEPQSTAPKATTLFPAVPVSITGTPPKELKDMSNAEIKDWMFTLTTFNEMVVATNLWLNDPISKSDYAKRVDVYETFKAAYKNLVATGKINRGSPPSPGIKKFEDKMKAEGEAISAAEKEKADFNKSVFDKPVKV